MGYDSRLYVIRKSTTPTGEDDKFKYAEIMAVYEICVFPPFQELFNKDCPATKYAPYDRDDAILFDNYGDPLRERSLDEVISCLETLDEETARYARVAPLLALLREYQRISNDWYELAVLHYGH